MTKTLRKAVMLRTRFLNKYNQNRIAENWNNFRRQRNLCVKLFRTEKKRYYNNSDVTLHSGAFQQGIMTFGLNGPDMHILILKVSLRYI